MNAKNIRPTYIRRTSESLSQDPTYLNRLFGVHNKSKSYPVSPERNLRESGYVTDQNDKNIENKKKNPYKRKSQTVYIAGLPPVASYFKPKEDQSQEPFPYEIPEDPVPRRSTLFYDMQYGVQDPNQHSLYIAEKPIEDELPIASNRKSNLRQGGGPPGPRRVTITTPSEDEEESENVVRRTVVRFRPHSSGSYSLRESVKFMSLRASDVNHPPHNPGRYVHQIPLKPSKHTPPLMTIDGKLLKPVVTDKIKRPSVISEKEIQSVRISVVEPLSDNTDNIPKSLKEPSITTPVARKSMTSANRNSMGHRRSMEKRKSSTLRGDASLSTAPEIMDEQFPYKQQDEPLVYAVPTVPTRGRSRSVLQQSVKSLVSRHSRNEPNIYRKNIRYSMDTDVFSADTRRRSETPTGPGYVNMERGGQPMLVSEVLNPITSLFVTNLKDPVPKDPVTKPKETNKWVTPRRPSVQRQSISRQLPGRTSPKILVQERKPSPLPVKRRQSKQYYRSSRDDSSSSDETIQVYRKKSKPSTPYQRPYQEHVYAAQMPQVTFPDPSAVDKGKNPSFRKKGKEPQPSTSKDLCGLSCEEPYNTHHGFLDVPNSGHQTDIDDLDLICYPSDKALKNSTLDANDSNSKLRWRIIIKRGDEI